MKRRFSLKELGQTSVEYLLLIAVSIGLGITFYNKMKEYFLDNQTGYFAKQLKVLESQYDKSNGYKRFPLTRYRR